MAMAAAADGPTLSVMLKNKHFQIGKDDLPKIKAAVAKAWQPTLRAYKAQLSYVRSMWESHNTLREDAFWTSRVIETVARANFPSASIVKDADTALAKLVSAVNGGNMAGAKAAAPEAFKAILDAAKAMETYNDKLTSGATNCVTALTATRDLAVDILEVTAELATIGKPGASSLAAAGVGSYKELLNQIEQAQGPDKFDGVKAAIVVLSAGAREGLLKEIMKDGVFGKKCVEYATEKFAVALVKKYGKGEVTKVIEKMFEKGLEEAIVSSLRELIKGYTGGQKITLAQAVQHVAEEVFKKARLGGILQGLEKQLDKVAASVLKKIAAGAIKGVKVEGAAAEKELRKVIDTAGEKILLDLLVNNASSPEKLADISTMMEKQLLSDSSFKAQVAKLAQKKK